MNNVKVTCAGCDEKFLITDTVFYRNKRWCQSQACKEIIDFKVKNKNYRKAMRKIEKGTFRHGVDAVLRNYIKDRDNLVCRLCINKIDTHSAQVHHITPVSCGGSDDVQNLVLLCASCHVMIHQTGWENYTATFNGYTKKLSKN